MSLCPIEDFPGLAGGDLVYLDSAATTQKCRPVLEAVRRYHETCCANVHRGAYRLSALATEAYEESREAVARFIGASRPECCIFTSGTTDSVNMVVGSWGEDNVQEGDVIVLTVMEHHSNLVPWQQLALRKKARLHWVEIRPDGTLDLDTLPSEARVVAITWVSNVFGTVNPIAEVRRRLPQALLFLDAAQGVPHLACRVDELGCDFLAFSGHKLLGPTGIGVLWGRHEVMKKMRPYRYGGSMISAVTREETTFADLPQRFEAGTPNIAGAIGLGAAVRYLEMVGMDRVLQHERALLGLALERLKDIPGLELLGPCDVSQQSGVISMRHQRVHPHDLATLLDDQGICVRAGHHCCQPLMREFGMAGTIRASFYVYNGERDVERLAEGVRKSLEVFSGAR